MYLHAKQEIQDNKTEITLGNFRLSRSLLDEVSEALETTTGIRKIRNDMDGRGIMSSSNSRDPEVTWTGLCQPHLHNLLFRDYSHMGILIHQATSRKRENTSANPELADWGVYKLVYFLPGDPVSFTDCKLRDIEHASRTSVCHSVNGVGCGCNINDWPVLVSIPSIPEMTRLEIHIPVKKAMWYLPIVTGTLWDKAILCSFFYAVHTLIQTNRVTSLEPIECNHPLQNGVVLKRFLRNTPYEPRVFCSVDIVYKYFDTSVTPLIYHHNHELIKECGNLTMLELGDATSDGRIKYLKYKYIEGDHTPTSVNQFTGALQTLQKLHQQGIVHGDVRLPNIIFSGNNSYLIDFDLARKVGDRYPIGYTALPERHIDATSRSLMSDRHSMASIMKLVDCEGRIHPQVADINIHLNDIIAQLVILRNPY